MDPLIYKWLDFGNGKQRLSELALSVFLKSPSNLIRVCHDSEGRPYQFFCLQGFNSAFRTATIWAARGHLRPPVRVRGTDNLIEMLRIAFCDFGLKSVSAWAVECNRLSITGMEKVGFREFGRQRQCHVIDGEFYDRVHLDITANDFFRLHNLPRLNESK
jgi:hypothetical protein